MTRIFTPLKTDHLDNDRFVQVTAPFICELDCLNKARVTVNAGFVQDFESIPILRGRNKRGGTIHDYLSCFDSKPVVTKSLAAEAYFEMNAYTDSIDHNRGGLIKVSDWARRWSKWAVVYVWPCYFHKRSVYATPKEIAGIDCDPYVTIDKAIAESQEATEAIKEIPASEQKADIVEASEQVTTDLKREREG